MRRPSGLFPSATGTVAARKRLPHCVALACVLVFTSGCYHLGPNLPKEYSSIAVPEFKLGPEVFKPRLQTPVTNALIKRLQADGALRVLNANEADAILEGEIVGYDLQPLRYQRSNQAATREYRLVLTAHVVLRKRDTNEVLVESERVDGETSFFILGDLTTSEHQALPLAADDLARNIVKLVGEGW